MKKIKFPIYVGILSFLLIFISTGCNKKKKKKTTPQNKSSVSSNKCECKCPKIRICTSKEAVKNINAIERCIKWQTAYVKSQNSSAKPPLLEKKEYFITPVNPIGIIKFVREDDSLACREVDLNGDGLMDLFYFYDSSGANVMEIQQDTSRDGIIDIVRQYKNGALSIEKYNTDGDENTWEIVKTYSNGSITQIASKVINPENASKRVCENLNYFENFDSNGKLVTISYDLNCDGKVDFIINKSGSNSMKMKLEESDNNLKPPKPELNKAPK